MSTANKASSAVVSMIVRNRNPAALQRAGLAPRRGFGPDDSRTFFHRLRVTFSNQHITSYLDIPDGSIVLTTSTKEFPIAQHLYGTADVSAARNIGRVTAQRLNESGITHLRWSADGRKYNGKIKAFVEAVKAGGITLSESAAVTKPEAEKTA